MKRSCFETYAAPALQEWVYNQHTSNSSPTVEVYGITFSTELYTNIILLHIRHNENAAEAQEQAAKDPARAVTQLFQSAG